MMDIDENKIEVLTIENMYEAVKIAVDQNGGDRDRITKSYNASISKELLDTS